MTASYVCAAAATAHLLGERPAAHTRETGKPETRSPFRGPAHPTSTR